MTRSLSAKLIIFFLLIGLVPTATIGVLTYINASDNISDEVYGQLAMYSNLVDQQLDDYFAQREGDALTLSVTRDVYQSMNHLQDADWDTSNPVWLEDLESLQLLGDTVEDQYGYRQMFITDPWGGVVFDSENQLVGTDLSVRDYVQGSLGGRLTWSEIFYSEHIGENCMVVSVPILSAGNRGDIIGTLCLLMDQHGMDQIVHDGLDELGASGDAYLVNAEGLLLTNTRLGEHARDAALNERIDTEAVQRLAPAIRNSQWDFDEAGVYMNYLGNSVLGQMEVARLGDQPVGLIIEIDEAEAFAGMDSLRNIMLIIGVVAALLIPLIAYILARGIVTPIITVSKQLAELAKGGGDLTQTLEVTSRDEVGQLASSFNAFISNIEGIIVEVMDATDQASSAGDSVRTASETGMTHTTELSESARTMQEQARRQSESTNEAASNTRQVAEGVEQVATGAQEQASSIEDVQNLLVVMTQDVDTNTTQLIRANELATTSSQHSTECAAAVEEVNTSVSQLKSTAVRTNETMAELQKASEQIGKITEMIRGISGQTNLLALNAAIEAVRAGEAGKGFTVLAEEIRSLSEQAAQATDEIAETTQAMQQSIESAVRGTTESLTAISHTAENTENAHGLIVGMRQSAEETGQSTEELRVSFEELKQRMEKITSSMQSISSVVEENTAATEEMAAGSEEAAASMDQVSEISKRSSAQAESLRDLSTDHLKLMEEVAEAAELAFTSSQRVEEILGQFQTSRKKTA